MKQSFVAGLYGLGLALSNYAPARHRPRRRPHAVVRGDQRRRALRPEPALAGHRPTRSRRTTRRTTSTTRSRPRRCSISNGWTDDLFPPDEAIRFYNRTRTNHPGTPIALIFTDHGHQRGPEQGTGRRRSAPRQRRAWFDFYVRGHGPAAVPRRADADAGLRRAVGRRHGRLRRPGHRPAVPGGELGGARAGRGRGSRAPRRRPSCPPCRPTCRSARRSTRSRAAARARARARADQAGAATYRSDPRAGRRLHAHGLADHRGRHPLARAHIAARRAPARRRPRERHADAGRARPLSAGDHASAATCQVFQLHPNGWKFAGGSRRQARAAARRPALRPQLERPAHRSPSPTSRLRLPGARDARRRRSSIRRRRRCCPPATRWPRTSRRASTRAVPRGPRPRRPPRSPAAAAPPPRPRSRP